MRYVNYYFWLLHFNCIYSTVFCSCTFCHDEILFTPTIQLLLLAVNTQFSARWEAFSGDWSNEQSEHNVTWRNSDNSIDVMKGLRQGKNMLRHLYFPFSVCPVVNGPSDRSCTRGIIHNKFISLAQVVPGPVYPYSVELWPKTPFISLSLSGLTHNIS